MNKVFRRKCLTRCNDFLDLKLEDYSPWMGLLSFVDRETYSKVVPHNFKLDDMENTPDRLKFLSILNTAGTEEELALEALEDWQVLDWENRTAIETVNATFPKSFDLITGSSEFFAQLLPRLVDIVIPLNEFVPFERGFSDHRVKGAIFITPRSDDYPVFHSAVSMAHELGHQVMMLYQTADPLIEADDHKLFSYSAARKTDRPVIQCLHASFALAFMQRACMSILKSDSHGIPQDLISQEMARFREGLKETLLPLFELVRFTAIGKRLAMELKAEVGS